MVFIIQNPARSVEASSTKGISSLCPSCLAETSSSTVIFQARWRNAFMFAIALSTSACRRCAWGTIQAIARPCDDNGLPTPDVIKEVGKVSLGLRFDLSIFAVTKNNQGGGLSGCSAASIRSLASSSNGAGSVFAAGGGMASDTGSDQVAANEYVNLDRRQSWSAIGRGSMPTPAHHEASSP
jgi:hypothetical protein